MPTPLFDPNFTPTPEQQAAYSSLVSTPGKSLRETNTLEQLKAAGANVDVGYISPTNEMGIRNPELGSGLADAAVAGARSYSDYLKLFQEGEDTAASREATSLREGINTELLGMEGRGAAQLKAEEEAGVTSLRNELANVNAQILAKTAEYDRLSTSIAGKPITMSSIIGEQAQVQKAKASEIGLLNALALGKQGQLSAAQQAADRAVDLAYEDRETRIDIMFKQLELVQGTLDKEEKRRSQALELYLTDQKEALAEQKANAKQFQNMKIMALSNGLSASAAQAVQSLYDAGQVDEAYAALSPYTGSIGREGGGSDIFSNTQESKGADSAGVGLAEFNAYDADTKNYFVNNADEFKTTRLDLQERLSADEDLNGLRREVAGFAIPQNAKQILFNMIDDYERANPPAFPVSTQDVTPWWNIFGG